MREESIFAEALLIAAAERGAYLERACAGDAELRLRVEALLAAHAESNVLDRPAVEMARTGPYAPPDGESTSSQQPGTLLGAYKLLEKIGEGGMGEVWVAEQSVPIRRRVALKLIKSGMDSKQVLARFEAERQALALMDHPHIARVLDAGSTPEGRPFFVMELVKGTPITDFCDARRLPPRDRLALFVAVCQAIQHAHTKGIIHRDIKPSNVLVELHDDRPVVKVIDFGVAKAVGQQLTEKTIYTGFGTLIGTPAYMAPEQATFNALDVDTRSDVYALGVLLYELLSGSTPFEPERLKKAALDEVLRLLREEEPPRPSDRLSTSQEKASIAAARQADPDRLARTVRGELDWITMKALEKDRSRRYGTAADLAADVGRYLRDEQVEACPPSWGYRAGKFLRKHRAALTLAGTAAVLLLVGVVVSSCLAWWAMSERDKAIAAERIAAEEGEKARREAIATKVALEKLRRSQYMTEMGLIQSAWDADNVPRVAELLARQVPQDGEEDLRNFEWHYWDRQLHQERRKVKVPNSRKEDCMPLPDGTVALWDKPDKAGNSTFRLVEPVSGRVLFTHTLRDHTTINQCVVSRDGRRCALVLQGSLTSTLGDHTTGTPVVVWDIQSGKQLYSRTLTSGSHIRFSDDCKRLAVATEEQAPGDANKVETVVKVWEIDRSEQQPVFEQRLARRVLGDLTLSPDGRLLAARTSGPHLQSQPGSRPSEASNRGKIGVWEVESGQLRGEVPIDPSLSQGMHFSPDGTRLVRLVQELGKPDPTTGVLATRSVLVKWDCTEGGKLKEVYRTELDFLAGFMQPDQDGQRLAVYRTDIQRHKVTILGSRGQTLRVIKWPDPSLTTTLSSDGLRLFGISGGSWGIAPTDSDVVWHEWEIPADRFGVPIPLAGGFPFPLGGIPVPGGVHFPLAGIPFPLGRMLFPGGLTGRLSENVVRSPEGTRQATYPVTYLSPPGGNMYPKPPHVAVRDRDGKEVCVFREHTGAINHVRFSPNGRLVYSVSNSASKKVYEHCIWEADTGIRRKKAESATPMPVISLNQLALHHGMSPDYPLILWPDGDEWKVMDLDSQRLLCSLGKSPSHVVSSVDGRRLVTQHTVPKQQGNEEGVEHRLWDVAGATVLAYLPGHHHTTFSPDGRQFVSVRNPATSEADVWDSVTGKKRFSLDLGKGWGGPLSFVFNADGTRLITTWEKPTLWDLETGKPLCRFESNDLLAGSEQWAFSPDGTRIARLCSGDRLPVSDFQAKVTLWDAATGRDLLSVSLGKTWILPKAPAFSKDGYRLLVGERLLLDATPREESKR